MLFALLFRYLAVHMLFLYLKISQIRLYCDNLVNPFPNGVSVYLEIMDATFSLPDVQNLFSFPFYNYLCLFRVALFPRNSTLYPFLNRCMGLSATPTISHFLMQFVVFFLKYTRHFIKCFGLYPK